MYQIGPAGLPEPDQVNESLNAMHLPYMHVSLLIYDFAYGIVGKKINVPVDVSEIVDCLPRHLGEYWEIKVNIERKLAHKLVCIVYKWLSRI